MSDPHEFVRTALAAVAAGTHPDDVRWSFSPPTQARRLIPEERVKLSKWAASLVPAPLIRVVELAVLHSSEERFDLPYQALWRSVHTRGFNARTDACAVRMGQLAQGVRREAYVHRQRLQLRAVPVPDGFLPVALCHTLHGVERMISRSVKTDAPRLLLLGTRESVLRDGESMYVCGGLGAETDGAPSLFACEGAWQAAAARALSAVEPLLCRATANPSDWDLRQCGMPAGPGQAL